MARRQTAMEAGERDRYIYLVPITAGTTPGFPVETDGTPLGMYASKQDIGGREQFAAAQLSAPYTTRWEVNYRADIDPDLVDVPKAFRLTYQGRGHDITAASMIGRKEGVEILTLARQG